MASWKELCEGSGFSGLWMWSSECQWMSRKFYIVYLSSFVPKAFRYALERILKSYVLISSNILSQLHYVPFFFSQFLKVNLDTIWFYPCMSIDQHNPGNVRWLWTYYYSQESEQRVFPAIYDPVYVRFFPQLSPSVYLELNCIRLLCKMCYTPIVW